MDTVDGFVLRVEENGQGPVVWVSGELDFATSPLLGDCLEDFYGQRVTVDFSGVTFVDSSGVAVLARWHQEVGPDSLVLRGVQPGQTKIFEITRHAELLNFDE